MNTGTRLTTAIHRRLLSQFFLREGGRLYTGYLCWDLRTLNNAEPYFFLNKMNKKDLPAIYSTAFWCLFVVLLVFLALLRNHSYSFHRTKRRLVTLICRGLGPLATRMPFFSPKFKSTANFSAPAQDGNLFFLSGRSARKKIHNFPIKSSYLYRTSRHVWLSSSACDHCCAYQLICIITISTYTTGARAEITRQLGSSTVKKRVLAPVV